MSVRVLIDSPKNNSSITYCTGYSCLDPVCVIDINGEITGFFPATEFEKAKKQSLCSKVINLTEELDRIKTENKYISIKAAVVFEYLKSYNIQEITVPESFPVFESDFLRDKGIIVNPLQEPFYPERLVKNSRELEFIRENSRLNVEVMHEVYKIIASSSVDDKNQLHYNQEILTSEYLKSFILKCFLDRGLTADSVIAAPGIQGCDPHESGYGIIHACESIIIDIFPKSMSNLYYSDMTRTFCKWKATDELKKLYESVKEVQKRCSDSVTAGKSGKKIHESVVDYFQSAGYSSGKINGVLQGFFHGTGHGVGLDCHEAPYISKNGKDLPENSIVTVEPGLYYLSIGAVRIEDLVCVGKNGCDNFTEYPKELIIP